MIKLRKKNLISLVSVLLVIIAIAFYQLRMKEAVVNIKTDDADAIELLSTEEGMLTIWWDEGYVEEEKTFFEKIVSDWEKENGKKIQLVFFEQEKLIEQTKKAIESGNTPDIAVDYSRLVPHLAWKDKLKDVSEIIKPIESSFPTSVLKYSYQYNQVKNQKSYYAVPIYQEGIYLNYRQDLLEKLGYSAEDIPQNWNNFWQFWITVQQQLKSQQEEVFGLGFSTSPYATDTFLFFEYILEAYNVKILNEAGELLVESAETRQGIINVLKWWTELYKNNYIPPAAVAWENIDNNYSLYNRIIALTPNPSLSIPAARAQESDVYLHQLGTVEFPRKPNGEPMSYLTVVRQAVVFSDRNFEDAKSFLSYLIQPVILINYINATGGRFFPVNKSNWDDPFWTNPEDPHLGKVRKMLTQSPTRAHYFSDNPSYMEVFQANVWGQALNRIILDGISPEESADEAIAQIKQIFENGTRK